MCVCARACTQVCACARPTNSLEEVCRCSVFGLQVDLHGVASFQKETVENLFTKRIYGNRLALVRGEGVLFDRCDVEDKVS